MVSSWSQRADKQNIKRVPKIRCFKKLWALYTVIWNKITMLEGGGGLINSLCQREKSLEHLLYIILMLKEGYSLHCKQTGRQTTW